MKKIVFALVLFFISASANAASEVSFPTDWSNWDSVTTTLTKIGALPGCEADVSALPDIYQETVGTYCAVKTGRAWEGRSLGQSGLTRRIIRNEMERHMKVLQ